MPLPPPPPAPAERKIVHPAYCPIPIGDDLYKCTNKVTLCGPTGQLHVMAAIIEYMHRKEWKWHDGDRERHVRNEAITKHFTGVPALAVLKATAAVELHAEPLSPLRQALWYRLSLKTTEVPVLVTFMHVPDSFKDVLMSEIRDEITSWRRLGHSTETNSIVYLPRMAQREPGVANAYWRVPWVSHHVLGTIPEPNAAFAIHRTSSPFDCDIQIPQLGRGVLSADESTWSADHQEGRQGFFGKPWLMNLSVDTLAYQFLDAVVHLDKALNLMAGHHRVEDEVDDLRSVEILRIMLIRDLVETYGSLPEEKGFEYSLHEIHLAARLGIGSEAERHRLLSSLTRDLSDRTLRAYLSGAFARKYCGGVSPRFLLPGAGSEAFKRDVISECSSTFDWLIDQLPRLIEDRRR